MCGIAGIVSPGRDVPEELLRRMAHRLRHRGPDDEGFYTDCQQDLSVALAHRRLSIIDLSGGHQPISNEDRSVWVVFNGEIYNFQELRQELTRKGHQFKTDSDTEVIVHGYETYGTKLPKYLRGMFAFALWDKNRRRLFLARDRVGKKPLFYSVCRGHFAFSSELPALLELPWISKEISPRAIHDYLTFLHIPAPLTIYQDVQKLMPGHSLIWEEGKLVVEPYWNLEYLPKLFISEREVLEEIRRLFQDAVKVRLMSEVPLGAFLSGGIDSSTVVAVMASLCGRKIKTFSIGFEEQEFNELPLARAVARRYETDHHEEIVKPDAIAILPELVRHFGEPFADASAIPTYYLSKMTRQRVTVALSGDGGDELFAGYNRHLGFVIAEKYRRAVPKRLREGFLNAAALLSRRDRHSLLGVACRFLESGHLGPADRYLRWTGFLNEADKNALYQEDAKIRLEDYGSMARIEEFFNGTQPGSSLDVILKADTLFYLPNDLLYKVDMMSMAHSLEVRSPFLDSPLLEFVSRLPCPMKLKYGRLKYLLKKAFQKDLPLENLKHRKMGFAVPMAKWVRGPLKEAVQEGLLSDQSRLIRYFRRDKIKEMVVSHLEGQRDYGYPLWALLVFERWHREFLK